LGRHSGDSDPKGNLLIDGRSMLGILNEQARAIFGRHEEWPRSGARRLARCSATAEGNVVASAAPTPPRATASRIDRQFMRVLRSVFSRWHQVEP
jgi:hypothetical protein